VRLPDSGNLRGFMLVADLSLPGAFYRTDTGKAVVVLLLSARTEPRRPDDYNRRDERGSPGRVDTRCGVIRERRSHGFSLRAVTPVRAAAACSPLSPITRTRPVGAPELNLFSARVTRYAASAGSSSCPVLTLTLAFILPPRCFFLLFSRPVSSFPLVCGCPSLCEGLLREWHQACFRMWGRRGWPVFRRDSNSPGANLRGWTIPPYQCGDPWSRLV